MVIGSNPVLITMGKRYPQSSNQDLKNDSAECLRREWDIRGTKEIDTSPPSSVGTFHEGCLAGFVEIENRNNYSSIISRWGNLRMSPKGMAPHFQCGIMTVRACPSAQSL